MRIGRVWIRKYGDGRWGFDHYADRKRMMVRVKTREKAKFRAMDLAARLPVEPVPPVPTPTDELLNVIRNHFAPVPPPRIHSDMVRRNGTATLPNESGIYFLWQGSVVAYVGQTVNLARRLSGHERLYPDDQISYLRVDRHELLYHEAFYIGVCRPHRNFGPKVSKKYLKYIT
jgi:hypothetical protein